MAPDPELKRVGGRVTPESFDAWHELHARTGASISAVLEVAGPYMVRLVAAGDERALGLIAEALRVQAERARRT